MENNLHTYYHVRKDIEEELNKQLLQFNITNYNALAIYNHLDIKRIEEAVLAKYNHRVNQGIKYQSENEDLWNTFDQEYDDYDIFSQNLYNKSVSTQLHTLNRLLTAYVIDTKQKSWLTLSRSLQQCLISTYEDIFKKSLKIHFKIVSTPITSNEGYLNIIQALILMFNSNILKTESINLSNKTHSHIVCMFRFILKFQKVMLKNWLHTKQKTIEDILITFIYLLNHNLGGQYQLGALDFLAMLDPKAKWFQYFCYGLQTRTIVIHCFKKAQNLIKHIFKTFLDYIHSDVELKVRQFLNFSHSANFISELLKYQQSCSIFPISLNSAKLITFECFVVMLILQINRWNDCARKNVLVTMLKSLVMRHNNLILHSEIQIKFLEPLNIKAIEKKHLYMTIEKNIHILEIITHLSKSPQSRLILSGLSSSKRSKRLNNDLNHLTLVRTPREKNIPQIIVNITIACIRYFINNSEVQNDVNAVIFDLIDCCQCLFDSNARTSSLINVNKLVLTLRDFYKTILNNSTNDSLHKSRISNSLCFFIAYDCSALKILESESKFLHEVVSDTLMNVKVNGKLILNLANYETGCNIITDNHNALIKNLLTDIWLAQDDINQSAYESKLNELFNFIHIISYSFKAVKALLCYENEGTFVQDQKPLLLSELIENCLDTSCDNTADIVLGFNILQILMRNLDLLLYLNNNYKIQENLKEIRITSNLSHSSTSSTLNGALHTPVIIDECSVLYRNILLSIEYGRLQNEMKFQNHQSAKTPLKLSPVARRYPKVPNDFQKFLHDARNSLHDHSWLLQVRRLFRTSCKEKYKMSVIIDLIEQVPKTAHTNLIWPLPKTALNELFPEELHGIATIVRFGVQKNFLQLSFQNEQNLSTLLKQSRTFLNHEPKEFEGFDWFVVVIFLMCNGNLERCKMTLSHIANIWIAPIIWPLFGKMIDAKRQVYDKFYLLSNVILEDTTTIHCVLQSLRLSPTHMIQKWLSQCFFTILEFSEICNFVAVAVLFPPEYVLFFIMAVFDHMKENIFTTVHESNMTSILNLTYVMDFHLADYFYFMDKLYKCYKNIFPI